MSIRQLRRRWTALAHALDDDSPETWLHSRQQLRFEVQLCKSAPTPAAVFSCILRSARRHSKKSRMRLIRFGQCADQQRKRKRRRAVTQEPASFQAHVFLVESKSMRCQGLSVWRLLRTPTGSWKSWGARCFSLVLRSTEYLQETCPCLRESACAPADSEELVSSSSA